MWKNQSFLFRQTPIGAVGSTRSHDAGLSTTRISTSLGSGILKSTFIICHRCIPWGQGGPDPKCQVFFAAWAAKFLFVWKTSDRTSWNKRSPILAEQFRKHLNWLARFLKNQPWATEAEINLETYLKHTWNRGYESLFYFRTFIQWLFLVPIKGGR